VKLIQDPRKVLQIRILEHFSSRRMTSDTRNHAVPRFDSFPDSYDPNFQFIVMPVLRRFDDPEFGSPCEVVDFISQALEVSRVLIGGVCSLAQPQANGAPMRYTSLGDIGIGVFA
jgi:hypothetical protein